jgi:hypothetical protein
MRLLNTFTYEVREFVVDIPHYTILSHTWGAEEVTYYDVVNKQGLDAVSWKQGYPKLMGFCKEAARHGFKWVWMDSCCIDKTSSAELSESINSMFDWYRDAVVCYVYLVDFLASEGSEFHFAISGGRSRWFTRGWTLQELLAPENVVFYDQNWKDSGTKRSLATAIASITGIDQKLLSGETRVNDYSVAQKMSWASMRDTTRVEDMAYSLLGLFRITMPLLYGEGLRSFARLQEEIIRTSTDQTIFAWRMGWLHATEYDFDRGILASSPADFRDSGRIVQASGQSLDYAKYDITNTGLLIDLPVHQEEDKFVGVLNCHDADHPSTRLGVLLKKSMFTAGNTSNVNLPVTSQGDWISPLRVLCRRVAPDLLRNIQAKVISEGTKVPLTINPLWIPPASRASRFPLVDVSLEHDMGESGFSLSRSSSLLAQDSSRRLMCYIFGDSAGKSFGVKLQLDDGVREAVRSHLEVMVSGEAALEDWTTEPVATPLDQAEAIIGDNEEWRLRAKIRHRIKENRRGQILSLILRVSLESIYLDARDSPA